MSEEIPTVQTVSQTASRRVKQTLIGCALCVLALCFGYCASPQLRRTTAKLAIKSRVNSLAALTLIPMQSNNLEDIKIVVTASARGIPPFEGYPHFYSEYCFDVDKRYFRGSFIGPSDLDWLNSKQRTELFYHYLRSIPNAEIISMPTELVPAELISEAIAKATESDVCERFLGLQTLTFLTRMQLGFASAERIEAVRQEVRAQIKNIIRQQKFDDPSLILLTRIEAFIGKPPLFIAFNYREVVDPAPLIAESCEDSWEELTKLLHNQSGITNSPAFLIREHSVPFIDLTIPKKFNDLKGSTQWHRIQTRHFIELDSNDHQVLKQFQLDQINKHSAQSSSSETGKMLAYWTQQLTTDNTYKSLEAIMEILRLNCSVEKKIATLETAALNNNHSFIVRASSICAMRRLFFHADVLAALSKIRSHTTPMYHGVIDRSVKNINLNRRGLNKN